MSRAPVEGEANDDPAEYSKELADVYYMLKYGRSWSGNERNCCFLNTGKSQFCNVSYVTGLDHIDDSRSIASVDWDFDGDQDIWIANRTGPRLRFMRNDMPTQNHFVSFYLEGTGAATNRDAIGARVEVVVENSARKFVRTLTAGDGYQSQSSKWLSFGMGGEEKIAKVNVRWPGGESEDFSGVELDKRYRLVQGRGAAEFWAAPKRDSVLTPSPVKIPAAPAESRIFLAARYPMPQLKYERPVGVYHDAIQRDGRAPTLVTLWATWCLPCREELKEFGQRAGELRAANLSVVALNVDGLGDQRGASTEEVFETVRFLNFPFAAGLASLDLVDRIQFVHDLVVYVHDPIAAVPVSLLIDRGGNLAAIYNGRVDVDQLLVDVRNLDAQGKTRLELASPQAGKWYGDVVHEINYDAVATSMRKKGFLDDAIFFYKKALADEATASSHFGLALVYNQQQRLPEAEEHFRRSVELKPDPHTIANHALVLEQLGRINDAIAQFKNAIERDVDKDEKTHFFLARALLKKGLFDEAEKSLRNAVMIDPEYLEAILQLGTFLVQRGKTNDAIALYKNSLDRMPNDKRVTNSLGVAYASQGKSQDAIAQFKKALEIDPEFEPAKANLRQIQADFDAGEKK